MHRHENDRQHVAVLSCSWILIINQISNFMFNKLQSLLVATLVTASGFTTLASAQDVKLDSVVLRGNVIQGYTINKQGEADQLSVYDIGMYSFILKGDTLNKVTPTFLSHLLYSNSGGVFVDSLYYCFFEHEAEDDGTSEDPKREIIVRKYSANSWKLLETTVHPSSSGLQATDMCYDPIADKVYGIFNIVEDGSSEDNNIAGYRLGTIDLNTLTVTPITNGYLDQEFRSLAVSPDGRLYGFDSSGNFYEFNLRNGQPKLIGFSGHKTQRRIGQGATFDQRTGKLYWLSYTNSGKDEVTGKNLRVTEGRYDTGLYEVNTETGVATLIKLMPRKEEVVGLYVVGGDIRQEYDLKVELETPSQIKVKEAGTFNVFVKNLGKKEASDYKVNLYCNNKVVSTIDGDKLAPNESKTYNMYYTATVGDPADSKFYAELVDAKDTVERNNTTDEKEVKILLENFPTVTLTSKANDADASVTLNWQTPDLSSPIVDGAESYAPFLIDGIGNWTMIDGDKGYTVRLNSEKGKRDYPNAGAQMAFMVFNPLQAGLSMEATAAGESQFRPYQGNNVFAAFASAVPDAAGDPVMVQNDDWMISPELSGKAQTVKFHAQSYASAGIFGDPITYTEKVLVYYTTEDADTTKMVQVGDTISVPDAWTEFQFNVPEGAKHFAIRCVSYDQFFLMLDNIEYMAKPLTLKSYNIYRDGEKIAEADANATSYKDTPTKAVTHKYNLTVVYEEGESAFSNTSEAIISGLETVTADMQNVKIFTATGQLVYQGVAANARLDKGIYIMKVGDKNKKVIVK